MSFFDNLRDKAEDLAEGHADQIASGLDKAADLIDEKTGGEHSDKIDTGVEKAKDFVEDLAKPDGDEA